jgi:hypothetical protein
MPRIPQPLVVVERLLVALQVRQILAEEQLEELELLEALVW